MKRTYAAVVFGMIAMWSVAASASTTTPLVSKDTYTVGKGDLEIFFALDPEIIRGAADSEVIQLKLGANYFLTDIFAPGMEIDYAHAGGDTFRFLPNLKAYWPLHNRVLPYAQIGIGYAHASGVDLFDFAIGPGVDFMLSNTVAIGIQFRYDLLTGDGTLHELQFPIDFALYFKL